MLPRCEQAKVSRETGRFSLVVSVVSISPNDLLNALDQNFDPLNGFSMKSNAPALNDRTAEETSPYAVRMITGLIFLLRRRSSQQMQARGTRHADVEHNATRRIGVVLTEEILC